MAKKKETQQEPTAYIWSQVSQDYTVSNKKWAMEQALSTYGGRPKNDDLINLASAIYAFVTSSASGRSSKAARKRR